MAASASRQSKSMNSCRMNTSVNWIDVDLSLFSVLPSAEWESLGSTFRVFLFLSFPFLVNPILHALVSKSSTWAVVREAPILEDDHRPDITGTPIMLHGELKTPGMGEASMICGLRDRTSPDELLVT